MFTIKEQLDQNSKAFKIVAARPDNPDYKEDREKILKRMARLMMLQANEEAKGRRGM